MTISSWYVGSWGSVDFEIFHTDSKLQRFKIIIKPDLSDASLHLINMSEITSGDFLESLKVSREEGYRICEDALVYFWSNRFMTWGVYVGLTSAPFTNVVKQWSEIFDSFSLCPTSGRFVYINSGGVFGTPSLINSSGIVVVDLF